MVRWILPSELDPPLQAPALRARTRASGTANGLKRLPPPRRTPRNLWNTAFSFLRSLEPGCGDAAHEVPLTGEKKSEDRRQGDDRHGEDRSPWGLAGGV